MIGLLLVVAALAGCGIKGEPVPPEAEVPGAER
jgi:predicted small lipoprotein YifL